MKMKDMLDTLSKKPIILGMKEDSDFALVRENKAEVVFVLYGSVSTILDIVRKLKTMGKIVFVNIDMVDGFSSKTSVIDFLKDNSDIDGIISTKPQLLRYASRLNIYTVHRFFILDSSSWRSIESQLKISCAHFINIAPGWTKVIKWTVEKYNTPVIASGLVCDKSIVLENLEAGAIAICTTNHDVWNQ